jgi:glycosyltransferase involved in cell wall biosynthesis
MNITYLWTSPSGYLSSCIRALVQRPGVCVTLIAWEVGDDAPFDKTAVDVENQHSLDEATRADYAAVKKLVVESRPDVVVIAGWAHEPYVRLCFDPALSTAKFVIGADTPIRFDLRQLFARLKIGGLLKKVDALCVPGERGFQVMRYWKVPGKKISRLLYGIDYDFFSEGTQWRWVAEAEWPKRFTFAGRLVPIKGLDILVEAYKRYREAVSDPWPLTICGTGPMGNMLRDITGIETLGFAQPDSLRAVFQRTGVFVLPSRLDPWGQVIVEAAAAGLPVICTQACGASAEMVRDYHNGLIVPPGDPSALAAAFRWMHEHPDRMQAMGLASQRLAAPFCAQRWAENQHELAKRLCGQEGDA